KVNPRCCLHRRPAIVHKSWGVGSGLGRGRVKSANAVTVCVRYLGAAAQTAQSRSSVRAGHRPRPSSGRRGELRREYTAYQSPDGEATMNVNASDYFYDSENAAGIPIPDMDPKISQAFSNP